MSLSSEEFRKALRRTEEEKQNKQNGETMLAAPSYATDHPITEEIPKTNKSITMSDSRFSEYLDALIVLERDLEELNSILMDKVVAITGLLIEREDLVVDSSRGGWLDNVRLVIEQTQGEVYHIRKLINTI